MRREFQSQTLAMGGHFSLHEDGQWCYSDSAVSAEEAKVHPQLDRVLLDEGIMDTCTRAVSAVLETFRMPVVPETKQPRHMWVTSADEVTLSQSLAPVALEVQMPVPHTGEHANNAVLAKDCIRALSGDAPGSDSDRVDGFNYVVMRGLSRS